MPLSDDEMDELFKVGRAFFASRRYFRSELEAVPHERPLSETPLFLGGFFEIAGQFRMYLSVDRALDIYRPSPALFVAAEACLAAIREACPWFTRTVKTELMRDAPTPAS